MVHLFTATRNTIPNPIRKIRGIVLPGIWNKKGIVFPSLTQRMTILEGNNQIIFNSFKFSIFFLPPGPTPSHPKTSCVTLESNWPTQVHVSMSLPEGSAHGLVREPSRIHPWGHEPLMAQAQGFVMLGETWWQGAWGHTKQGLEETKDQTWQWRDGGAPLGSYSGSILGLISWWLC